VARVMASDKLNAAATIRRAVNPSTVNAMSFPNPVRYRRR
jgi:hypothetical protein